MDRLTPELWLISAIDGAAPGNETRELDFNLARRSAVVINNITGQMFVAPNVTTGFETGAHLIQELDTDPDNVLVEFGGAANPDAVVMDSSRVFRQFMKMVWDTAAGVNNAPNTILQKDWTNLPIEQRPISITPMRHNTLMGEVISQAYHCEIHINYIIVELSLLELGIINASRR